MDGAPLCVAGVRPREVEHHRVHRRGSDDRGGRGADESCRCRERRRDESRRKARGIGGGIGCVLSIPRRPRRDRPGGRHCGRAAWWVGARRGSHRGRRRARDRDGFHRAEALPALSAGRMRASLIALALLIAVAVIWCGQAIARAERSTGNDLVGYLTASRAVYAQQNPYRIPDRFPYVYPLFLATVVRPLASLDVRVASAVWYALQWGGLLYVLRSAQLRIGQR